jgi:predicted esterase
VPEWQALRLAPEATEPTVRAALSWLEEQAGMEGGRRGLIGFSFGAPQAIALSAVPELEGALAGVVAFGGYADLERTVRFQLTGEHGWQDRHHRHPPDPYGRWIVAGNHLTGIPGYEGHADVAEALLELARRAGDARVPSRGPFMETVKREVRPSVAPGRRALFDFVAPPGGVDPRGEEAHLLARQLAEAAVKASPGLDVRPRLPDVRGPVHLVHGRSDHLIPFTEAWRMADELPPAALAQVTVTALFGHSAEDRFPWQRAVPEITGFAGALARLLGVV